METNPNDVSDEALFERFMKMLENTKMQLMMLPIACAMLQNKFTKEKDPDRFYKLKFGYEALLKDSREMDKESAKIFEVFESKQTQPEIPATH